MEAEKLFVLGGIIVGCAVVAMITFGVYNAGKRELVIQMKCLETGNQFVTSGSGTICIAKQGDVPSRE